MKLTFSNMQQVAQIIFGMEIQRSGSKFTLLKGETLLGEANGTLYTLKDIHSLFQEWLDHPDVIDLISPHLRAALGITTEEVALSEKARSAALSVGVMLERAKNGFFLFLAEDGDQLGYDFDQPWSAQEVIDYCAMFQEGIKTGEFVSS